MDWNGTTIKTDVLPVFGEHDWHIGEKGQGLCSVEK
jgi:hypothetical protein